MALEAAVMPLEGSPRVGPPLSATTASYAASEASQRIGLNLYPWQDHALDVMMSMDENNKWLYREVAVVVARQNGKTKLLVPRILAGLERGERFIHTAQNRLLPRKVFRELAKMVTDAVIIRHANGQEEIATKSGGSYIIVAPQRGARGESADILIIDELREMEDFDFIAAAEPTLSDSANPQVIYLSNAGTQQSVVLNDLRLRAAEEDSLAYMEWSAAPERASDDQEGWLEANPAIGYSNLSLETLEKLYRKYEKAGELAVFETEHLCRWVQSMLPRLVSDAVFQSARAEIEAPLRPSLGVKVEPNGRRASAVLAWRQSDGSIAMRVEADVTGDPIDIDAFALDLEPRARRAGVRTVAFDPWTDKHLADHFSDAQAINGQDFANASERFVRALENGALHWQHADAIAAELRYASRKQTTGSAFMAEPAPGQTITTVLAAIRAVWLASNPKAVTPSIY